MNENEVRAYYDDLDNAAAMCALLMGAHPGWVVWRERSMLGPPMWCASRKLWRRRPPLMSDNAGNLNSAMFRADEGLAA